MKQIAILFFCCAMAATISFVEASTFARFPSLNEDGSLIAFSYQGSANKDIWLYQTETRTFLQLTGFEGQDYHPVWGDNRTLYFISSRSGKYNIFFTQLGEDGILWSEPVQITGSILMRIRHSGIR